MKPHLALTYRLGESQSSFRIHSELALDFQLPHRFLEDIWMAVGKLLQVITN